VPPRAPLSPAREIGHLDTDLERRAFMALARTSQRVADVLAKPFELLGFWASRHAHELGRECPMCGWTAGTNPASCGECLLHARR
jgi:hypothetical protein